MKLATAPDRADALSHLYAAMRREIDNGQCIPCQAQPSLWLSEDHAEQEAAAWRCLRCPVLDECSAYLDEHEEVAGVWAATTPNGRNMI